jgi:methanogenic corrinoid protein MtbC1
MLAIEQRSGAAARFPVRDLIGALLSNNRDDAMELAVRMRAETGSRTSVFADLLHPAQAEISNLWYTGRVSYADEVRVARTIKRIVATLEPTPSARLVPPGSRCVLAVPHGDPHDLGLQMFMLALQDHGWTTEVLGPVRHLGEVTEIVAGHRPRLVGLSAGFTLPLPEVSRAISAIRRVRIPVLVGGVAFNRRPDLWRRLGADGLGMDARVGVVLAEKVAFR